MAGERTRHQRRVNSNSKAVQLRALTKAATHFRVARNLPTEHDSDQRYEPVHKALSHIGSVSSENLVGIVGSVEREISRHYGNRKTLSLTTKFLRLKFQSPVRIYDRQARVALKTSPNDYTEFNEAFTHQFRKHESEILRACERLGDVIRYTTMPDLCEEELEKITSSEWFAERVFDIYLWNLGNSGQIIRKLKQTDCLLRIRRNASATGRRQIRAANRSYVNRRPPP